MVLRSETLWIRVWSTVASRSRSSSPLSLKGSVRETYALTSPTIRIVSASAALTRLRSSRAPTVANAPVTVSRTSMSMSSSGPGCGISPKFLATIAAVRETRLPQPATSSELLRWTKSRQVKAESWFSGPAAQM